MKRTLIAAALLGTLASGAALADSFTLRIDNRTFRAPAESIPYQHYDRDAGFYDRDRDIDGRQAILHARVQRGLAHGALTRNEARRAMRELALIESRERAFESDGRLTRWERAELHRELDRAAWNLRYQLRDEERRY